MSGTTLEQRFLFATSRLVSGAVPSYWTRHVRGFDALPTGFGGMTPVVTTRTTGFAWSADLGLNVYLDSSAPTIDGVTLPSSGICEIKVQYTQRDYTELSSTSPTSVSGAGGAALTINAPGSAGNDLMASWKGFQGVALYNDTVGVIPLQTTPTHALDDYYWGAYFATYVSGTYAIYTTLPVYRVPAGSYKVALLRYPTYSPIYTTVAVTVT